MSEQPEAVARPTGEVQAQVEAEPKKKKRKGMHAHYKLEEGKLKRMLPFCERCGPGYFMADHRDRYTCGHCGFTRYKLTETSK